MNKKITLDEFFKMGKRAAIHCDTGEKAKMLLSMFDKAGKRWWPGKRYSPKNTLWGEYGQNTLYYNDGSYGSVITADCFIFEFEDIISEDTLIKSITLNDKKKITTVVFADDDVKMVKCGENDTYNPETGIVYCIALKYSGLSKTQFKKMIDKFIPKGDTSV